MGIDIFTQLPVLYRDSVQEPTLYRRWTCILRYWNRLLKMDNSRLTKQVFNFDTIHVLTMGPVMLSKYSRFSGIDDQFKLKSLFDLTTVKSLITQHYKDKWSDDVLNMAKLRT